MLHDHIAGIDPATLRHWYADGDELALLDARDEADFSVKNIFFASCLPFDRIELRAPALLPRHDVRIVVTDGAGEIALRAAKRLRALGYVDVSLLEGGVAAWEAAGYPVYSGVHVPSKAFAEVVEEHYHTPWIDVNDLSERLARGDNLVVLDSRTAPEFRRAAISAALCVPGGDLLRYACDIAPDPATLVVVNCGGRTRSIIGAQALINAGLPNRVVSLKDGLLSWRLQGLPLEEGTDRDPAPASPEALAWGARAARRLADAWGVGRLADDEYQRLRGDPRRTTYLIDVRSPADYAAGHRPGAVSCPGGQLVQEADSIIVVQGARIVLTDDANLIRADATAAWLVQLGYTDVFVLEGDLRNGPLEQDPREPCLSDDGTESIGPTALAAVLDEVNVVDIDFSTDHKAAHIPGAWLGRRTTLGEHRAALPRRPLVLTSRDGRLARVAAAELGQDARWLKGGTQGWIAAGLPTATGIEQTIGGGGHDVWLSPTQCDGDRAAAARAYLAWELALAAQVRADPDVRFKFKPHSGGSY